MLAVLIVAAVLLVGVPQGLYALGVYPGAPNSVEALRPCSLLPAPIVRTVAPEAKAFPQSSGCEWSTSIPAHAPGLALILTTYRPGPFPIQTPQVTARQAFEGTGWSPGGMRPISNLGDQAVGRAVEVPTDPSKDTHEIIQARSGNVVWTLVYFDDRPFPQRQVMACAHAIAHNLSERL